MDEDDKAKELISNGAQIAGAAVGGALGFFAVGPAGAAVGSMVGAVIPIVADFAQRHLSQRERLKAGAGLAFACDKIAQYLQEGLSPRSDGFFDVGANGRSSSDEILEGVLLKCKNEHEENKARLIGNIYANVAFMPDISIQNATYMLHLAERLTYRQLCVIALVQRANEIGLRIPWGHLFSYQQEDSSFIAELRELSGLVHGMGNTSDPPFLEPLGLMCYAAMSLGDIPAGDLQEVARLIRH